jgi:putative endonuclease
LVPGSNPGGPSLRFGAAAQKRRLPRRNKVKAGCAFDLFHRRSKEYGLAGQQINALFYVYILVSQANETIHYTGVTRDLEERLLEHNRGKCPHTSKHRPWRVETAIAFKSEQKARGFEKYLKSESGREFARRHF